MLSLYSENRDCRVREAVLEKEWYPSGPLLLGFKARFGSWGRKVKYLGERLRFDLGHIIFSLCKLGLIGYEKMNMLIAGKPREQAPGI